MWSRYVDDYQGFQPAEHHDHAQLQSRPEATEDTIVSGDTEDDMFSPNIMYINMEYTPNCIRWVPNSVSHLRLRDNEELPLIVSGYGYHPSPIIDAFNTDDKQLSNAILNAHQRRRPPECSIVQMFTYSAPNNQYEDCVSNNINEHGKLLLPFQISDIQFAADGIILLSCKDGSIKFVRMVNSNDPTADNADTAMADNNADMNAPNRWSLQIEHELKCTTDSMQYRSNAPLTSMAVGDINGRLAVGDEWGNVFTALLESHKNATAETYRMAPSAINAVEFASSDTLALATMSGQLLLYDMRQGFQKSVHSECAPIDFGALCSLAVHPHINHIYATGSQSGCVNLWDLRAASSSTGGRKSSAIVMDTSTETVKDETKDGDNDPNKHNSTMFAAHCRENRRKSSVINHLKFVPKNTKDNTKKDFADCGLLTCGNDGCLKSFWFNKNFDRYTTAVETSHALFDRTNLQSSSMLPRRDKPNHRESPIVDKSAQNNPSLFGHGMIHENELPSFIPEMKELQYEPQPVNGMDFDPRSHLVCSCSSKQIIAVIPLYQ